MHGLQESVLSECPCCSSVPIFAPDEAGSFRFSHSLNLFLQETTAPITFSLVDGPTKAILAAVSSECTPGPEVKC